MVVGQLMFTAMNIMSRLGGQGLPWSEVAGVRFVIGALVAMLIAQVQGNSLRTTNRTYTWLRSISGTLASLCFFYSITSPRIPLGDAITLGATAPIFVALLSVPLLGERVGPHVLVAVTLAFLGVIGVVQPTFHSALDVAVIATLGALGYGFAMIWLRKMGPNENSEGVALHFSVVAAVANMAIAIPVWKTPTPSGMFWLVGTGVTGGIGQVVMTRAFAMSRAAPLSVLGYLSIIFTYLLAIPIFGERSGAMQIGGAALVIGAGLILAYDAWRQPGGPGLVAVVDVVAKD
jgi:drug/metabolite transporter (DMT)-like permease